MYNNNRKTIGVFICRTSHYFQRILCSGIINQANKLGYNVAFFSSFGNYNNNEAFCIGEQLISKLPEYNKLDGVILALDTIDIEGLKEDIIAKCKEQCNCPVICIREEVEGLYNFNVDDDTCMEGIIRHFVEEHRYRDICFLTGKKGLDNAEKRLACFRRVMKENNLEVNESNIKYGTYWKNDGKPACEQFIDKSGKLPEAIICANDFMAISVCNELISRGIRIPEDVAVCGYDGIWESLVCTPTLSTVKVPFYEMGEEAVTLISRLNNGEVCEKNRMFDVELVLNESCGCVHYDKEKVLMNRKEFYEGVDIKEARTNQNTFMTIDLEEIENMKELTVLVGKYIELVGNYKSFYLCLCEGISEKHMVQIDNYTENIRLYMSVDKSEGTSIPDEFFDKSQLLPDSVISEEPQIYFFMPLHFKERCFGYTAIRFYGSDSYGQEYQTWMANLGNAIEEIYVRNKMKKLIDNLEEMYVRDTLTGLYNRRGFEKFGNELLEKAKEHDGYVYAIAMDLDGLKGINDNYGHSQGDIAIEIVAEAIQFAAQRGEVCARMGGDEFNILGFAKDDVEKQKEEFIVILNEQIKRANIKLNKPYTVGSSYGVVAAKPQYTDTLETYMNKSDREMYRMKATRKRRVNDRKD